VAPAERLCPYRLAQLGHLREDGVFTPFSPAELAAAARATHDNVPFVPPEGPTNPFGAAYGVLPGRVTWAWFEGAARWDGSPTNYWWQPHNVDQRAVDEMFSASLRALTGAASDTQAWQILFSYHNQLRGRTTNGFQRGERIAIKANLVINNGHFDNQHGAMTSPQAILALLRQLVYVAGVPTNDIFLYDSARYVGKSVWDYCRPEFKVHYVDYTGGDGREQAVKDFSAPMYLANGTLTNYPPTCVTTSDYLINLSALKSHEAALMPAVRTNFEFTTLSAKNHFGSLCGSAFALHPFIESSNSYLSYHVLPDLMEHRHLGGKTMLHIIDGLYGGLGAWNAIPTHWSMPPFNSNWPCSLFMSQDACAIDSVGLDFVRTERELQGKPLGGNIDHHLHEAALITNPPSGHIYDPDGDGPPHRSLGVHEHWLDYHGKQYLRDFDPAASNGIELVQLLLPPAPRLVSGPFLLFRNGLICPEPEPADCVELYLTLTNIGKGIGTASNVLVTITSASPFLSVSTNVVSAGDIEAGAAQEIIEPVMITIASNCPDAAHVLDAHITARNGAWLDHLSVTVRGIAHIASPTTNVLFNSFEAQTTAVVRLQNAGSGELVFNAFSGLTNGLHYTWNDSRQPGGPAFAWRDISASGTALALGDDGVSSMLPLATPFVFYGRLYTHLQVSANGVVTFQPGAVPWLNQPLPTASGTPGPLIAAFWDDLNSNAGGSIRWATNSTETIVAWLGVPRYGTSEQQTFQVVLCPGGTIVLQYLTMQGVLTSATIGVQSSNAPAPVVQLAYNAPFVTNALAVELRPRNASWLAVFPEDGTIAPWSALDLALYASADTLTQGTYYTTLVIQHNAPGAQLEIPVEFLVPEPAVWWSAMLGAALARRLRCLHVKPGA